MDHKESLWCRFLKTPFFSTFFFHFVTTTTISTMEIYPKKPIRIGSKAELDKEMRRIGQLFKKGETEETWESFNLALKNMTAWVVEDKAYEYEGFVDHLKLLQKPLIKILTTERTRLLGTATDLLKSLSRTMERVDYDQHIHDLFAPTLHRMFARTNKVMHTRTIECYKTIIQHAKIPRMIPKFAILLKSKKEQSKSVRQCLAACLDTLIDTNTTQDITKEHQRLIEEAIRATAMDSAPEVRLAIRCCYRTYCTKFPESVSKFEEQLPADIKKYLKASIKPLPKLSRTSSRSSISSSTSSTSSTTTTLKNNTTTAKSSSTAISHTLAGRITKHTVPRIISRPTSKSRYSAPQLATSKLPLVQRPKVSTSASLGAVKSKIPNINKASVLSSKPAAATTRKPGSSLQNNTTNTKNASHLTQLMRATASSSQKLKTKPLTSSSIRPIRKTFTIEGMKPSRPVMKRRSSSSTVHAHGEENKHPAKKQNVE
ncbi:clasp N terminal-domain-containing protein [Phascolomyces articulosus]|uniref:Clasp N terminal-domain-containing protein n=1 Tax=Phascolomyces articulosus TaxID=60185 RepID=A0AAD5JPU3_9FUNG|nr:clasp N terminal-domain-containing protein [Phascolomyces articulosus]